MKIFKYPIPVSDHGERFSIKMPRGAQVLTVQLQNGVPCIWAFVDPDCEQMDERVFYVFGTGREIDVNDITYVGTYQFYGYVWHLFLHNPRIEMVPLPQTEYKIEDQSS